MNKRKIMITNIMLSGFLAMSLGTTVKAEGHGTVQNGLMASLEDSTIPVKVSMSATPINVTLPMGVDLIFDGKDVEAQVANNYTITNNSNLGNIQITNVKAKIKETGW